MFDNLCVLISVPSAIHTSEILRMSSVTTSGSPLQPQARVKLEIGFRSFLFRSPLPEGSSMASFGEFSFPGDAGVKIPDEAASAENVKPVRDPFPSPSTVEAVAEPFTRAPFPVTDVLTVVEVDPSGDDTVRSNVTGASAYTVLTWAPRTQAMAIKARQLIVRLCDWTQQN